MDIGRSRPCNVDSWKKLIAYEICFVVQVVRKRKENLLFVLSFIFFEVLCIINFLLRFFLILQNIGILLDYF